jgi:hypothetical protein
MGGPGGSERAGERVRPRLDGQSLLNLPRTVAEALGAPGDGLAPPVAPDALPPALLEGVRAVLLLVVDGLGQWQLEAGLRAGDAPALAGLLDRARRGAPGVSAATITSVFPSSTVPALTTLSTGLPPGAHGLVGWTVYLEEFGEAAELARWGPAAGTGSYQDPELGGHDPAAFFPHPTLYERLGAAGVRSVVVCPAALRGSGLSAMSFRGAAFAGYHAASSLLVLAEQALEGRRGPERLYVYGYWSTLDTVSHHHGPRGPEHGAELAALDFALGRWLERHRPRGDLLLLLTADHGHVPTDPARLVRLDREPALLRHLAVPPTGERRLVYLHARPGKADAVRAHCAARLGAAADVLDAGDAAVQGLFGPGPLGAAARRRVGDLLLVARDDYQLVYPFSSAREPTLFRGNHGALDPREMLVPLLAVRL